MRVTTNSFYLIGIVCVVLFNCCKVSTVGWKELEGKEQNIQSFSFFNEQGINKSVYYFLPPSRSKVPAIIFYHGGAWTGGSASTFFAHAAYYAQHGIAAFSVDYRLLNKEAKDITQCIDDGSLALRSICKRADELGIDTTRIILCGESAGGHLASAVYLDHPTPQHIKALLLLNPVLDFNTPVFLPYMNGALVGKQARKMPADSMQILYGPKARTLSPIQYANRFAVPILLINGDEDKITPRETAALFFEQHPYKNLSSQFILLEKTGHAFSIPHYKSSETVVVRTVKQMDAFLQKLHVFQGRSTIQDKQYSDWLPTKATK